ncbi:hypothetical protein F4678DRAFT_465817 [Xylaria arbuscula]|nr:hypothetical protein F4678DRAFT_465817 [Xylaria arbuscula]
MFQKTEDSSVANLAPGGSKRHACDSCRKGKLRCPPREDASHACDRCLTLGKYCTTTDGNASNAPVKHTTNMNILRPGCAFPGVPHPPDPLSPTWPGEPLHGDETMSTPLVAGPLDVLSTFPLGIGHISPGTAGEAFEWTVPGSFSLQPDYGLSSNLNPSAEDYSLSATECGTRLASLRMKLSLHLQQSLYMTDFFDMDTDQKEEEQPQNPFGEALCYTSELLTIIRLFRQQTLGDASSLRSASTCKTTELVTMLDILSAHTQIITIYHNLFQQLYAKMHNSVGQEASDVSASELQTLPGLQLAGFSVLQGNLQTKILMEAMMHQLKILEKELSLPAELCVSKRTEPHQEGMVGQDMRTQHVIDSFFAFNSLCSTEHITNLRESIDQLTGVLEL